MRADVIPDLSHCQAHMLLDSGRRQPQLQGDVRIPHILLIMQLIDLFLLRRQLADSLVDEGLVASQALRFKTTPAPDTFIYIRLNPELARPLLLPQPLPRHLLQTVESPVACNDEQI